MRLMRAMMAVAGLSLLGAADPPRRTLRIHLER